MITVYFRADWHGLILYEFCISKLSNLCYITQRNTYVVLDHYKYIMYIDILLTLSSSLFFLKYIKLFLLLVCYFFISIFFFFDYIKVMGRWYIFRMSKIKWYTIYTKLCHFISIFILFKINIIFLSISLFIHTYHLRLQELSHKFVLHFFFFFFSTN